MPKTPHSSLNLSSIFYFCAGATPSACHFLYARVAPPPLASLAPSRSREPQAPLARSLAAVIRNDCPLSRRSGHALGKGALDRRIPDTLRFVDRQGDGHLPCHSESPQGAARLAPHPRPHRGRGAA